MLALASLRLAIDHALQASSCLASDVRAICLGLAGISCAAEGDEVATELQVKFPAGIPITVYNDAVTALAAGTGGKLLGCTIIVGTGEKSRPPLSYACVAPVTIDAGRIYCRRLVWKLRRLERSDRAMLAQLPPYPDRHACWQG